MERNLLIICSYLEDIKRGIKISPYTIRNILRRAGYRGEKKPRRGFYPVHWVWGYRTSLQQGAYFDEWSCLYDSGNIMVKEIGY